MVNVAFIPITTNSEFYFCRYYNSSKTDGKFFNNNNVSDDDENVSNQSSEQDLSVYSDGYNVLQRMESTISEALSGDVCPLFLHFVCTVKYNGGDANTSVKVLPTCLGKFQLFILFVHFLYS